MLPPPAATNPNTPIALARCAGSGKSDSTSDSATAEATAPPRPCTARAAIRNPCPGASPHASDAAVNTLIPAANSRRCPNKSPSRPPSSKNPPYVSM
jgi:hypothetical protein